MEAARLSSAETRERNAELALDFSASLAMARVGSGNASKRGEQYMLRGGGVQTGAAGFRKDEAIALHRPGRDLWRVNQTSDDNPLNGFDN